MQTVLNFRLEAFDALMNLKAKAVMTVEKNKIRLAMITVSYS